MNLFLYTVQKKKLEQNYLWRFSKQCISGAEFSSMMSSGNFYIQSNNFIILLQDVNDITFLS